LGAVPLALLGGLLFAAAPLSALTRLLGLFLLAMVVWRHVRPGALRTVPAWAFAPIGAVSSFLSALLGSVGPLMAPFFLAHGLVKGAYIGTEAAATVVMHIVKLAAYTGTAVLTAPAALIGLALGPVMVAGSFLGNRIVDRVTDRLFVLLIEGVLVLAGLIFLVRG
jgi:uncharacterized membrane protein YfcA